MANPFKESAKKEKVVSKESERKSPEVADLLSAGKVEQPTDPQTGDILAGLNSKKRTKKAYGYYLDEECAKKLERAAKAQKVSTSKLLNHIIKNLDI